MKTNTLNNQWIPHVLALFCVLLNAITAHAELIGGVDFPQGAQSFADIVVDYRVGSPSPTAVHQVRTNALGIPNNTSATLGVGGTIVLQFTDNALTGSGNTDLDLWIFEIGPDVEDTYVEISIDGVTWQAVGKVYGSTSGIDIDAYGFGRDDRFTFVRLRDDPNEGDTGGASPGSDIDAVGAISSTNVPPFILTQPQDVATIPGEMVNFTLLAGGTPPLHYQWRFGGADLLGATAASLSLTNVSTDEVGQYSVVVTNTLGSVTSSDATLELADDVHVTTAVAIVWPSVATRAGFVLEEADDPAGPWRSSFLSPGTHGDLRLILADTQANPKLYYRLRRP